MYHSYLSIRYNDIVNIVHVATMLISITYFNVQYICSNDFLNYALLILTFESYSIILFWFLATN